MAAEPEFRPGRRWGPGFSRMDPRSLPLGTVLLLKSAVGILGNCSLLSHHLALCCAAAGCRRRRTDLLVRHLTVGNLLVLFSTSFRWTMEFFAWPRVLGDFVCRFFLYVRQMGRGVSMGTTCLLSLLQAVTLGPQGSGWARLKDKAPRGVVPGVALCWALNMLVFVIYPVFFQSSLSPGNVSSSKSYGRCSVVRFHRTGDWLLAAWLSLPDVLCVGLMLGASGSMVNVLHRHRRRVRHLHSTSHGPATSSPEARASRTILLLVSTFAGCYALSFACQLCMILSHHPRAWLPSLNAVLVIAFPAVSPFVLMSQDVRASRLCLPGGAAAGPSL